MSGKRNKRERGQGLAERKQDDNMKTLQEIAQCLCAECYRDECSWNKWSFFDLPGFAVF